MSKIQVSSDQLRSIYGQLYDVLQEKASLHLPELDDPVSREVNLQLQLFLTNVMEMAFNSLKIDGPPANDILNSRCEPFDLELNERVRKSYETWEEETVKVANLKRAAQETINNVWMENQMDYLRELDSKIDAEPATDTSDNASYALEQYPIDTQLYTDSLESLSKTQSKLPHMRNQLQKLQLLLQHLQDEGSVG
ncbi:hypothetical protein ZYGR_0P03150 [Zygosaccharomyces rouxii]|uniref:ZYRO0E07810p n=2 Tax=Zygosaccharomyces rouxii TaxID=4956 RepID=C5E4P8_ZYGRC|nr:uncharacterized protein ZYRO0E07810g [Zygosaccharomyces rouxii]KAH9198135.1 hypothetical protein LQ764DRAFT_146655 [Zygosaccharomyces rouxii]GAV49669.1 hypothetical protein ZYGR_0P03150 [Zygosaccharomyces rouxii]CAR31009.1 ZYRO0E07810p [Zygosaccharomyces rouxii]